MKLQFLERAKVEKTGIFGRRNPNRVTMKKVLTSFLLVLFGLAALVYFTILRSCTPTWFKPVSVHIKPISLSQNSCAIDTSGIFSPNQPFGFALNFDNKYVAEAAVEPGILGIADTLTVFSVTLRDSTGQWRDVTEQFFYGLPDGCSTLNKANEFGNQWFYTLPDTSQKSAEIQEFVRLFNHNFSGSGLEVERWNYTFWAKPIFAKTSAELSLQINLETGSGMRWAWRVFFHKNLQTGK